MTSFASYSTMPLAPVQAGLALDLLGGPASVRLLIALTVGGALIPTLSRSVCSVPRPASWPPPAELVR